MNMRHHDEQNQLLRETIIIELTKNPNLEAADDTLKRQHQWHMEIPKKRASGDTIE
jgi:translation initiation factor 2 beta subunit (eIF-2beta)/eIF-5